MSKHKHTNTQTEDDQLAVQPPIDDQRTDLDVDVDLDQLRADRDAAKNEFQRLEAQVNEAEGRAQVDAQSVQYDPSRYVAVDMSGSGVYAFHPLHDDEVPGMKGLNCDWPMDKPYNERYLPIGSLKLEHVDTVQGVWAYRNLDRQ